ncbi:MAG: YihY/virulence factor BrkB family protein [Thermoleophilia bacterium]|nr:YihY/virulence factor BrkB family protein [Thermoleophilia bacterium]
MRGAPGRAAGVGVRLARALARAVPAFGRHRGSQSAAAIAYHALFSLFPLAILLVSILGLVLQVDDARREVTRWLLERLPLSDAAGVDLERAVAGIASPASVAGLLALAGLLWSASGMMGAIRIGLNAVWPEVRPRPAGRAKLLDLAFVAAAGLLVLVSVGLTVLLRAVPGAGVAGELLHAVVPLALTFATFALCYRHVPAARPPLGAVWVGALAGAAGFEAAKTAFSFYVANVSRFNLIYGSLGAVLAFLFFVYLAAVTFLLGAELAAAWPGADRPGPGPPRTVRQQAAGALRGLFVHEDERRNRGG